MTKRLGINTSILVRLVSGDPQRDFQECVGRLTALVQDEDTELVASNQAIGEAYIALQHHYGLSKKEAREDIAQTLQSGLVAPLNGLRVLEALAADKGCGLIDRLIADDYRQKDLIVLTLDRKMAALPDARRL